MSDTFPNQHSGDSERWSFSPIEQLEHEMAADGVPPRVLDYIFGNADLAEELDIRLHPDDLDDIRRGVPAHLAHFMPKDWEDKLEQGLSPFNIAEPVWDRTAEEPESMDGTDEGMLMQTAMVWGVLSGRRRLVSPLTPERRKVKAELRVHKNLGTNADDFLENSGYPEAELKQAIKVSKKAERVLAAGVVAVAGLVQAFSGTDQAAETAAMVPATDQEIAYSAEAAEPAADADPAAAAPPAETAETIVVPEDMTTTTASTTPPAPSTVPPAPVLAESPLPKPAASKVGVTVRPDETAKLTTIVVNEPLSVEAKNLGVKTGDIDTNNQQQVYRYLNTIVAFNPNISDPDHVPEGTPISLWNCRNGVARIVFSGPEALSDLIRETGITAEQAQDLKAGQCYVFER